MTFVDRLAGAGCDLLLLPFASLPPGWGLLWLSLLSALLVLLGYRLLSSPARIRAAKESIKADILAIRLYRDFWRVVGGSFLASLAHTGRYFALNLLPLLLMLPLLVPLFVQMDVRFGMRPYRPGETVVVKAAFDRDIAGLQIDLRHGPRLEAAMNPVFIPALNEVNWKLRVRAGGDAPLSVVVGDREWEKSLRTGPPRGLPALSNCRLRSDAPFLDRLGYPAEPPLPGDAPLHRISIRYPADEVSCFGLRGHWLLWYILLVLVFALALKKPFGVEF